MVLRGCFSVVVLFTLFHGYYGQVPIVINRVNENSEPQPSVETMTHDQKVDQIAESSMILQNIAHTVADVHNDIQTVAPASNDDLNDLKNSHGKMDFEVKVMDQDHNNMKRAAAKRSEAPTPKEVAETEHRETTLEASKTEVSELASHVQTTETNVGAVNERITAASLDQAKLTRLQEDANANVEHPDEHITIPTNSDTLERAEAEITKMSNVVGTLPSGNAARTTAETLLTQIREKFTSLLAGDDDTKFTQLKVLSDEIISRIDQFKGLDIYGSTSSGKMEL